MHTKQLLESIAKERMNGRSVPESTWSRLGERIFYVPLSALRNSNDKAGSKKIKFLSVQSGEKKILPAFSSEDLFFEWCTEGNQFLPIVAADLALAAPHSLQLAFDFGSDHEVILDEAEREALNAAPGPIPAPEKQDRMEEEPSKKKSENRGSEEVATSAPIAQRPKPRVLPSIAEVEERLGKILCLYPSIEEGYFLSSADTSTTPEAGGAIGEPGGLLGLLVSAPSVEFPWDTEQRFALVEQIADLSRVLFGFAGAIEVYDDLSNEASRSWDLFKTQHVFYQKASLDSSNDIDSADHGSGRVQKSSRPGRIMPAFRMRS